MTFGFGANAIGATARLAVISIFRDRDPGAVDLYFAETLTRISRRQEALWK